MSRYPRNPGPGEGGWIYEDEDLELAALVSPWWPIIEGATFRRCVLRGPAVINFADSTVGQITTTCDFGLPRATLAPGFTLPGGTLLFLGCVLEDCPFEAVGVLDLLQGEQ